MTSVALVHLKNNTLLKLLNEFVHRTEGRQKLSKPAFCNLIAKIWREGLTKKNIVSGFQKTGILPVDQSKYNADRLDKVKLELNKKWKACGSPKDSGRCPIAETGATDLSATTDSTDKSIPQLHSAISSAIPTTQSTGAQKCHSNKLTFSVESFSSSIDSPALAETDVPCCSSTNSSTPITSSTLTQEQILEILEKNAPLGYKYCSTLVPRETDSMEKVLKN